MPFSTDQTDAIQAAIRSAVTAIDFCGNPDDAVEDAGADYGVTFSAAELSHIARHSAAEWAREQQRARLGLPDY